MASRHTSIPAIFGARPSTGSNLYNDVLASPDPKSSDASVFEKIAIRMLQDSCDIFKPV